jgi:hypothetical protein
MNYLPGWPQTVILPISASQVARTTGVNHWHLARSEFYGFFFFLRRIGLGLGEGYSLSSPRRSLRTSSMEPGTEKSHHDISRKEEWYTQLQVLRLPRDTELSVLGLRLSSAFTGHKMFSNSLAISHNALLKH